jgi:hypothetical protein
LCPSPTILVGGDRKEREGKGGYVMYPPTFKKGPYHTAVLDFANQKREIREKMENKMEIFEWGFRPIPSTS